MIVKYLMILLFVIGCTDSKPKFSVNDCLVSYVGLVVKIESIDNGRYVVIDTNRSLYSEKTSFLDDYYAKINCNLVEWK